MRRRSDVTRDLIAALLSAVILVLGGGLVWSVLSTSGILAPTADAAESLLSEEPDPDAPDSDDTDGDDE